MRIFFLYLAQCRLHVVVVLVHVVVGAGVGEALDGGTGRTALAGGPVVHQVLKKK